jgi:hypothetical protein
MVLSVDTSGENPTNSKHVQIGTELVILLSSGGSQSRGKQSMRKQYRFAELSQEEKEYHEMILLEEIDVQAWFAIAYSNLFDGELFVAVQ